MMRNLVYWVAALMVVGACSDTNKVDVNAKANSLRNDLREFKRLSKFQDFLASENFDCKTLRFEWDTDWRRDFPEQAKKQTPETVLVCFWSEETGPFTITFGSIRTIAYTSKGEILAYKTEDIYTGP